MPGVFISYARHDLSAVQQIEHALQGRDITVWRDQESIYGGQQWPKAIGEAIAANDWLLLVWSKSAARSHFVDFEWNSAVALRKPILPCLLDDTPLPPCGPQKIHPHAKSLVANQHWTTTHPPATIVGDDTLRLREASWRWQHSYTGSAI